MVNNTEPVASRQSDQSEHNRQHGNDCGEGLSFRYYERCLFALKTVLRFKGGTYRYNTNKSGLVVVSRVCEANEVGIPRK